MLITVSDATLEVPGANPSAVWTVKQLSSPAPRVESGKLLLSKLRGKASKKM
jgi:hypothetical protein